MKRETTRSTRVQRVACVALLATSTIAAANAQTATQLASYLAYDPSNGSFDLSMPMIYQVPDSSKFGPGPYPVFVWTPGTYEVYTDPLSLLFMSNMAKRGYLAVSVQYANNNALAQTCNAYTSAAKGIFDATRSTSAVGVACALPGANCAKGVVVSGTSQGGELAILARNYASQVQAAFVLSAGAQNNVGVGGNLSSCLGKQNTAIPLNRLTIVNGQADPSFGSQSSTQAASGYSCATGSTQCWDPQGSGAGWYIVQNSQVSSGSTAGHCYFDIGGCNDQFDPNWNAPATSNWSLSPNLDWLATFGTKRVFSATGK